MITASRLVILRRRPSSVIVTGSFSKVVRIFQPGGRPRGLPGWPFLKPTFSYKAKCGFCQYRKLRPALTGRVRFCASVFVVLKPLRLLFDCYSIVSPLLGPSKFVDRRKNSVDPPSNEFYIQPVDLALYFLTRTGRSAGKNADFRCFFARRPVSRGHWIVSRKPKQQSGNSVRLGSAARQRRAAAMLPPSTVVTSAVVLSATAWCRKA